MALKKFLYAHSFYSVDEFFTCTDDIYIANLYDCCKCIFYTIFLYICMFYDMFHILLSCDSLRDPWNVYCIVLYCNGADVTGGQRELCND